MKRILIASLLFLVHFASFSSLRAQTIPAVSPVTAIDPHLPTGTDLYSQALQAYLAGNYDQAILLDSKALQTDPQDAKAQALLSILVNEKDKANQTIIWIGKENVGDLASVSPPAPVPVVQEKAVSGPVASKRPPKGQGMAELEARVNAVAFLLERDSNNQYRELTGAQITVQKRLDEIGRNLRQGTIMANILFFLALLVALAALWKSWRNGEEIRRQMSHGGHGRDRDDHGRVVPMRKI